ncbi:MAG: drug/metabolite transporter (DMT)-like permease [Paracoccaceae bacterium]|jgi:drug/metabolite transporter (DMT)-like permease
MTTLAEKSIERPSLLIWALLVLLGIVWGSSFSVVSITLQSFQPITIAAGRITLAALVLWALATGLGYGLPTLKTSTGRRIWLHALGVAVLMNVLPFTLLSWGQLYVASGFAGITMAVVPLLVLPLAHFLVPGEFMNKSKAVGFLLGFLGVVILIGPKAFLSSGSDVEALARIACLGATFGYATGNIITRLAPPSPQLSFAAASLILAAAISLPLAYGFEGLPQNPSIQGILGLAYLGLVPTALATFILVKIITTAGPSFMVLVNFQVPVWAALMGIVFLTETMPPQLIIALVLILAGLGFSQIRRRT